MGQGTEAATCLYSSSGEVKPSLKIPWRNAGWREVGASSACSPAPCPEPGVTWPERGLWWHHQALSWWSQGKQSLPSRSSFPAQRESGFKPGAPFCPGTKAPGHLKSTEGPADSSDCSGAAAAALPPPLLTMLIRNHAGQPHGGGGEERGVGSA